MQRNDAIEGVIIFGMMLCCLLLGFAGAVAFIDDLDSFTIPGTDKVFVRQCDADDQEAVLLRDLRAGCRIGYAGSENGWPQDEVSALIGKHFGEDEK